MVIFDTQEIQLILDLQNQHQAQSHHFPQSNFQTFKTFSANMNKYESRNNHHFKFDGAPCSRRLGPNIYASKECVGRVQTKNESQTLEPRYHHHAFATLLIVIIFKHCILAIIANTNRCIFTQPFCKSKTWLSIQSYIYIQHLDSNKR